MTSVLCVYTQVLVTPVLCVSARFDDVSAVCVCTQVLVTSGLGGMSGAQAKAAVICGCIGVVAEVSWRFIVEEIL